MRSLARSTSRVRAAAVMGLCSTLWLVGCKNPSGPERDLDGKRVYDRHCARCHGLDGRPTKESPGARDLSNRSYMSQLSDDDLRRAIEMGKPPAMPAFGGKFMTPTQKLLIAYVRKLSDPDVAKDLAPPQK